jgi:hypothetical protein
MDIKDYIINSKTGKVLKIGGKAHKTAIINKIRNTDKNKTLISDIDYDDSKKLKSKLPELTNDKYYYYEHKTKSIATKNKSLKVDELIKYICDQLPTIMDNIIDGIDENEPKDKIKSKMISIFHQSLI